MRIAIVTGASSGLGREFVRQISEREKSDEIWIIARRENRLQKIAEECPLPVRSLPLDLTKDSAFDSLKALLEEEQPDVRLLINAAGFGKMGNYTEVSVQDSNDMLDLNCRALMNMTLTVLPYMQKGARILEICSSSAFQPLPALNVYSATKAFVLNYSRALRWELFGKGIHVTAVCPYWIRDTEFIGIAKDSRNPRAIRHFPLASHAASIAGIALRDSKWNLPVSTPGIVSFLQRLLSKFIPRELIIACWQGLRRI
ncbi:SDR family NAD(P)-dependent oxidoreductase [Eubacteriales bacterium mix99]|jgi:hypothetical protein|nr:short-chain dehydrogenase [Clostridiales bacterium]